jgi:hypothetical protein
MGKVLFLAELLAQKAAKTYQDLAEVHKRFWL